jgi:hypothetical protein
MRSSRLLRLLPLLPLLPLCLLLLTSRSADKAASSGSVHGIQTGDTERVSLADDSLPDLIVEDMWYGGCVPFESRAPLVVIVKNIGTAAAEPSTTEIKDDVPGRTVNVSTSPLPPGQWTNVWIDNSFFDGDTTASADSGSTVTESDENNNSLTKHLVRPACGTPTMSPTPTATPTATPMPVHAVSGTAYEFPGCMGYMRGWTVVLNPAGSTAQTDVQYGTFSFSGVPDGSYTLEMSASCNPYGCWDPVPVTVIGSDVAGIQICPHAVPTPLPTATVDPPAVGGIAEPPEDVSGTGGGGGLTAGAIAMLTGVAVVAATAGGWYARRRFRRQRR